MLAACWVAPSRKAERFRLRCELSFGRIETASHPIGSFVFARIVKTPAKDAARIEHAEHLTISVLFVRKRMDPFKLSTITNESSAI